MVVHYEKVFFVFIVFYSTLAFRAYSQCEADHLIILNNFEFVPSELTVDEINNKPKKIVFLTERLLVTLSNKKSLEQWLKKYPKGKFIIK